MNLETCCIVLGLRLVERFSVKECFRFVVVATMSEAHVFHGVLVEIRAEDLTNDPLVVRDTRDHAPPAELGEPPDTVLWLWIIAVSLAEDHVGLVLLFPAVPVVVITNETQQDHFFG